MKGMDSKKRKQLQSLLLELSIKETQDELDRFWGKKDEENAKMMLNVEEAISVLLSYLER